jgi:hypothetical protein
MKRGEKVKIISNAKYNEPVESGTIYRCKLSVFEISIHRIIHCDGWFLSCAGVGISQRKLKSESLMRAIKEGINVVSDKIEKMRNDVETLKSENIEISRY